MMSPDNNNLIVMSVSWIDVVVPIVVAIIIIAVSIYLFSAYCHPQEKGFGNAVFPKTLVILSQVLAWSQILLIPLDLGLGGAGIDSNFKMVYYIFYPIIFALVAFINPFAIFLYESDPNDSYCSRVLWSMLYAFIVTGIWSAFIFISYIWLGKFDVDGVEERMHVSLYIMLCLSLAGWVFLALNGAIGLLFIPYDLIAFFIKKPQPLSTDQAYKKKRILQQESDELITEGKELKTKSEELANYEGGWFGKKRQESEFNKMFNKYKQKVHKLEKEHQFFQKNIKLEERSPVAYIAALIFGCLAIVASVFWVIQILGHIINPGGHPQFAFMDTWFDDLDNGGGAFVATILFGILVIYIQMCMVHGNCIFGFRIPFIIKVHAMEINDTYMNSMLFNCNLMLLGSSSITFMSLWCFPLYFDISQVYLAYIFQNEIKRLGLFGSLYGERVPLIIMECLVVVVMIVLIIRTIYRLRKGKKEKKKQQKKASKVK